MVMRGVTRCYMQVLWLVLPSILWLLPSAKAGLVYSQPYVFKTDQNGAISDAGLPQYIADNFLLTSDAMVNSVTWYGYWGGQLVSSDDMSFDIRFYTDSSNKPDNLLFAKSVMASGTLIGAVSSGTTNGMYELTATWNSPVPLAENTTYWISIYDNLANGNPHFQWATAASGLDYYAWSGNLSSWGSAQTDAHGRQYAAFSLYESAPPVVPEPSTWTAAALLAGGAVYLRWRKRSKLIA